MMGTLSLALGLIVGQYIILSIYTVLTSPIRHVPGPWYAPWTDLVLKWNVLTGRKAIYVQALHERHGPVARVSPSQVDVSDATLARRVIHGVKSDFRKVGAWYRTVDPVEPDNVFRTDDVALHRRQRRLLGGPLSESGIREMGGVVERKVRLFLDKIEGEMREDGEGVADVMKWCGFLTTDVISELTFGESFQMLEQGERHEYFRDLETAAPFLALQVLFPFIKKLADAGIPLPGAKKAQAMISRTRLSAEDRLRRQQALEEQGLASTQTTLFSKVYNAAAAADEQQRLSKGEMLSNAQLYIVAGSDTTGNTLTYLLWVICRHPQVRARLLAELDALRLPSSPSSSSLPDHDSLRDLPYLNAVINETLRLYPPIPSTLPRHVPDGGAQLGDYFFPAGTIVSTQAWSLHRDAKTFLDPEEFKPERWLKPTKAMDEAFMPFGGGSRICIGLHLAMMELRLSAAHFLLRFPGAHVSTARGFSDRDMIQASYFIAFPRGKRCLIEATL